MKIIETNFRWNSALTRRNTSVITRVIVHHAAAVRCTVEDIDRWHKNNGWAGIGYHYFIRKNGGIYRGRPENTVGAHAQNHNADSIGICFEGNYDTERSMPTRQFNAGRNLLSDIRRRLPAVTTIQQHRNVTATACPGRHFPFTNMRNEALSGAVRRNPHPVPTRTIREGMRGDDVKWMQWQLNERGHRDRNGNSLAVDGIAGPLTISALNNYFAANGWSRRSLLGPVRRRRLAE